MTKLSSKCNQVEVPLTQEEKRELVRQYNSSVRYTDKLDQLVKMTVYRIYNNITYQDKERLKNLYVIQLQTIIKEEIHKIIESEQNIIDCLLRAKRLQELGMLNVNKLKVKTYLKYKVMVDVIGVDLSFPSSHIIDEVEQYIRDKDSYVGKRRPTSIIMLDKENLGSTETVKVYLEQVASSVGGVDSIYLVENPYDRVRELYVESECPHSWKKLENVTMKIIKIFQKTELVYRDVDWELFFGYIDGVLPLND
ncbi:hypothetical protein ACQUY5_29710 [Bacillus cereus]|uniref:hypothetical protein n=1 Tax=Bacillus cereus TaxID=1396 RepID=UPI003D16DD77